eukprot:3488682-Rhodomonas_salina.1
MHAFHSALKMEGKYGDLRALPTPHTNVRTNCPKRIPATLARVRRLGRKSWQNGALSQADNACLMSIPVV